MVSLNLVSAFPVGGQNMQFILKMALFRCISEHCATIFNCMIFSPYVDLILFKIFKGQEFFMCLI